MTRKRAAVANHNDDPMEPPDRRARTTDPPVDEESAEPEPLVEPSERPTTDSYGGNVVHIVGELQRGACCVLRTHTSAAYHRDKHTPYQRNAKIVRRVMKRCGDVPELVKRELQTQLIPEPFAFYAKTVTYTHAGEPRQRASTARPHQFHRGIGCPAKMNICVQYSTTRKKWLVNVTGQELEHNHDVTEEICRGYPENRRVRDAALLRDVQTLYEHGTPRKGILEYLVAKSDTTPSMKDVHNILARMKVAKYAAYPSVPARVNRFLKDFCDLPGHVGRVFTSDHPTTRQKTVKAVTIQTAHMRKMFEMFPKVVLVDTTHNVNSAHYKLFSFMVHDALGNGQHVQHGLIEDEKASTLRTVCAQFKKVNPAWEKIRAIITLSWSEICNRNSIRYKFKYISAEGNKLFPSGFVELAEISELTRGRVQQLTVSYLVRARREQFVPFCRSSSIG